MMIRFLIESSTGTAWRAAALPIGLVALALVAVAARSSGRARVGFAGAGLALGIAALVILLSAR
jgi:hypothetical protein